MRAGWTTVTVTELASAMFDGPFGSALKTSDYTNNGVRVARLENIGHLKFRDELESFVSGSKAASLARHTLFRGDVLFSSFVDRTTRVCVLPDELDGLIINKADCFCVRPNPEICVSKFIAYRLAAPSAYETFCSSIRGVTRPRIGLRDLSSFLVDLPPLAEQKRIVDKLDTLLGHLARATAEIDRAVSISRGSSIVPGLIDRLEAAILAKAFRGELVPQDPTDEPASLLLDRIRAQRAAAPAAKRGRRPALAPA
jgi:type I restriction enzyme S subunit